MTVVSLTIDSVARALSLATASFILLEGKVLIQQFILGELSMASDSYLECG